jgi:hypothetical protein
MDWMSTHIRCVSRLKATSTQVIMVGLLVTAVLVFAQTSGQWIDFRVFYLRLKVLDSDHHGSVFGVISLLAQTVAAAAIGMRAAAMRRLSGLVVGALVGLLTVPRALSSYIPAFHHYEAPILVVPLTLVCVVVWALTFGDARPVRLIVWVSLALLACSFALHAVGPQADGATRPWIANYTWSYQLTGMLKHSAELAGWMLLATGMVAAGVPCIEDYLFTVGDMAAQVDRNPEIGCDLNRPRLLADRWEPYQGELR